MTDYTTRLDNEARPCENALASKRYWDAELRKAEAVYLRNPTRENQIKMCNVRAELDEAIKRWEDLTADLPY